MKLFLDVGNTRIKWAWIKSQSDIATSIEVADSLEMLATQWSKLVSCNDYFIGGCCVRGPEFETEITLLARRLFDVEICWVVPLSFACGVSNAYPEPRELGADRWAAIVAAHARWPDQTCVVVDAGTAITIDVIAAGGRHRGGVILPGYRLTLESLGRPSQLFPGVSPDLSAVVKKDDALNTSTRGAILAGVVFVVQGGIKAVIERQANQLDVKIEALPILLTGGDAAMSELISSNTHRVPELVLEGVQLLTEESR
jgi:type III pantothenate kinase